MMTMLGSRPQRLAGLQLYLYSRPFHPELFQIYAARRYETAAWQADVWIIGCSHVVTFSAGRDFATELMTNDDSYLGRRLLLDRWRMRGEQTCRRSLADGRIDYIASFQVETLSANLYVQIHREMVREATRRGLLAEFPRWQHEGLVPFTYINAEACARELRIHAFHGFPEEGAVVKTQSIFELV